MFCGCNPLTTSVCWKLSELCFDNTAGCEPEPLNYTNALAALCGIPAKRFRQAVLSNVWLGLEAPWLSTCFVANLHQVS